MQLVRFLGILVSVDSQCLSYAGFCAISRKISATWINPLFDLSGDGELTVEDIRGLVMSSPVDSPYPRDPDEPLVATPPPVGTRPSTIRRLGSMDRQLSIELLSSDSLQDNDQFTSVDIGGGKGGDHDTGVNSNPVAYDSNTV